MTKRSSLNAHEAAEVLAGVTPIPLHRDQLNRVAPAINGTNLRGGETHFPSGRATGQSLLLFLSLTCTGCLDLFAALECPEQFAGSETEVVVILRSLEVDEKERIRAVLHGTQCLVSPSAWSDYRVSGPPFYVLVDHDQSKIITEGVAWGVASISEGITAARHGDHSHEIKHLDSFPDE